MAGVQASAYHHRLPHGLLEPSGVSISHEVGAGEKEVSAVAEW
jgi:hypothetical protein